ncbi:hypothetical protein D9M71_709970 [compost metagenome]
MACLRCSKVEYRCFGFNGSIRVVSAVKSLTNIRFIRSNGSIKTSLSRRTLCIRKTPGMSPAPLTRSLPSLWGGRYAVRKSFSIVGRKGGWPPSRIFAHTAAPPFRWGMSRTATWSVATTAWSWAVMARPSKCRGSAYGVFRATRLTPLKSDTVSSGSGPVTRRRPTRR